MANFGSEGYRGEFGLAARDAPDEVALSHAHMSASHVLGPGAQYLVFWKPGVIGWYASEHLQGLHLVGQFTVEGV